MPSACHHGATSSHAKRFCGSLLFLLFLTTTAIASDSTGNKGDTSSGGIRTAEIVFVGNTAFSSEKLLEVLSNGWPRWFTASGSINPNALHEATDILVVLYYDDGFLNVSVDQPQI